VEVGKWEKGKRRNAENGHSGSRFPPYKKGIAGRFSRSTLETGPGRKKMAAHEDARHGFALPVSVGQRWGISLKRTGSRGRLKREERREPDSEKPIKETFDCHLGARGG